MRHWMPILVDVSEVTIAVGGLVLLIWASLHLL